MITAVALRSAGARSWCHGLRRELQLHRDFRRRKWFSPTRHLQLPLVDCTLLRRVSSFLDYHFRILSLTASKGC